MTLSGQHVLGFSPTGKFFALINDQGILRIWDTNTNELKQEYTPNLHLSAPCSALLWISATSKAADVEKKSKKKNKKTNRQSLYIALGTSKGQVSLYSFAEAKIERNFNGEGHGGKITSISQDANGKLYTCGEDCQVVVWSIAEEKQISSWGVGPEKPTSICYLPSSNNLTVGSRAIKVYSAETQELVQTFTGHTSEVNLMQSFCIPDRAEYVLTTSRIERIICLWKIGKKGRNKAASATLLMEDIAHCLTCSKAENEDTLKIASVTRSGVIHIYNLNVESIKADKPIKPKLTISIACESAAVIEPISAIAASLEHGCKADQILFAYGDKHFMAFEEIKPNYDEKMQVLVRTNPKTLLKHKVSKRDGKTNAALKILTPIINTKDVDYKSPLTVSKKKLKSTDMPMESRLENLNINVPEGKVTPQSHSKVQLLVQSLHSKDSVLLRSVLSTKDLKTIQLTLQKLPVQYVGTLINELTLLMQQRHVNVEYAMNWFKFLVQTHSSQLMALGADDLLNKFGPCIGIIEHRANCLKELSKLNGRLQLLVSQIKRNSEELNEDINESVLVLEDNDDDDSSDLEDSAAKSASDGEWEEDEENADQNDDDDDENMEVA